MNKFVKSQKRLKKRTINRAVAWLLAVLMCFLVLPTGSMTVHAETETTGSWNDEGNYATGFASGTGTLDDPYIIKTAEQLAHWSKKYSSYTDSNIKVADGVTELDLSAHYWTPINKFNGSFDGNGVTIKGLTIDSSTLPRVGFFDQLGLSSDVTAYGVVKNLNFQNVKINVEQANASYKYLYVGVIAGRVYSATIENCKVLSGTVDVSRNMEVYEETTNAECTTYVGGLVGYATYSSPKYFSLNIYNCYNACDIEVRATSGTETLYVGGIAGYLKRQNVKMLNTANTGDVTVLNTGAGGASPTAGGLLGRLDKNSTIEATIFNCYNAGKISAADTSLIKSSLGGIVGCSDSAPTMNCCYYAADSVTETDNATIVVKGTEVNDVSATSFMDTLNTNALALTDYSLLDWQINKSISNYPVPLAEARVNATYYSSLTEVIGSAEAGAEIDLLADIIASSDVTVNENVTLDLNGYTMDMGSNYLLSEGDVVDNSPGKTGRLKIDTYTAEEVAEGNELSIGTPKAKLAANNSHMPIYISSESAYMLANMTAQASAPEIATDLSSFSRVSRPSFGTAHVGKLQDGATKAGLQFILRLDWGTVTGGVYENNLEFSYSDELVGKIYTNGTVFSVTVNGLENYASSMKVIEYVISDLGVKFENNSFYMSGTTATN